MHAQVVELIIYSASCINHAGPYGNQQVVRMYEKYGSISDRQRVFDGFSDKVMVSWNAVRMLTTYV